jgi:hypothetical protein
MISTDDFVRNFPVVRHNDRDAEAVLLTEFLKSKGPFKSLLDIGAHHSATYYANTIRSLTECYDAIDILHDPEVAAICDNYYQANANEMGFFGPYEAVTCVSVIEHAGTSTYKGDPYYEQMTLFKRCLNLSTKYVWISFPVGQPYVYPNELSVIHEKQLDEWEKLVEGYKVNQMFLYNQGPQMGHPWHQHRKRDVAVKIPYIDFIGNQSICVMEIEK